MFVPTNASTMIEVSPDTVRLQATAKVRKACPGAECV
jgi:hypothetical protein